MNVLDKMKAPYPHLTSMARLLAASGNYEPARLSQKLKRVVDGINALRAGTERITQHEYFPILDADISFGSWIVAVDKSFQELIINIRWRKMLGE